ncbi:MAG: DUF4012 domain-containing protein [bacterium]|nr:DUF4012 domain-containing protein [bacterium]
MTSSKWLTEIISSSVKVFVNHPRYELSQKISELLEKLPDVELVKESDPWEIIIYLAGYERLSEAETLQLNSRLHQSLDKAMQTHARFLLVVPSVKTPFGKMAQTVVQQFGKNFGLSNLIVETLKVASHTLAAKQIVELLIGKANLFPAQDDKRPPSINKSDLRSSGWGWWVLLIFVLFSPWLFFGSVLAVVLGSVVCIDSSLTRADWGRTVFCSHTLFKSSRLASDLLPLVPGVSLGEELNAAEQLGQVLISANQVMINLLPYGEGLVKPQAVDMPTDTSTLSAQLTQLTEQLAELQVRLQGVYNQWPPLVQMTGRVSQAKQLAAKMNLLVPQLPRLLALSGQARWLVLLQDNTELRPTGGFVSGIALVSMENGHITSVQFLSSAEADSQLNGQVLPPTDLRQATGETNWYLRDSNWDANFPTSAARAAWFVEKELDQKIDGVMTVNLSTLGKWLQVVGPVTLADFEGQITATNWMEKYLGQIKADSATEFTPRLAEAVYDRVSQLPPVKLAALMRVFILALETRQVQIWPLSYTANALSISGWSGELSRPSCSSPYPCVNDFVYQADANVGINKVDPYIGRQLQVNIKVKPKDITTSYTLIYNHRGQGSSWPMGEYKDYVRMYVPIAAEQLQIKLDSQALPPDKLSEKTVGELREVGFMVMLPPGQTRQIEMTWRLPAPSGPRWHYQLELPNQPGLEPYPVQATITYPGSWWSQAGSSFGPPQFATMGQIRYNSQITRPLRINIDWVPSQ